jgi:hypothetical protein
VKQLCTQIPPKDSNLDGVGRFKEEILVSEVESVCRLSQETERDSEEGPENASVKTAGISTALLREDHAREVLMSQEAVYAKALAELYLEYGIAEVIRETTRLMNEAYCGYETKGQEAHSLFILKENYEALSEYFEKTKKVGLGLPDKTAMRIGHLLYSLEVVIRTMNK